MKRRQCKACPWKTSTRPERDIPGGYDADKHRDLKRTVRSGLESIAGPVRVMACHESAVGEELPCVGWLVNQIGPGNNIGLRLAIARGKIDAEVETVGPQHATLEKTLPRRRAR